MHEQSLIGRPINHPHIQQFQPINVICYHMRNAFTYSTCGEMHVKSSIGHFINPFFIFSFTSQTLTLKGQCHLNFFHN